MYIEIEIGLILIELNEISLMKPSAFEISQSVETYDKKNLPKIDEISTMPKSAQFPNYIRYRSQILIRQF